MAVSDLDFRQLAKVAGPPTRGYLSTYYYQATPSPSLATSGVHGNGVLRVGKVRIADRVKIDRLGASITIAGEAGSVVRIAVFNDSATTPNYPGALLLDAGTIPGDAVAVAEVTVNLTLEVGVYWFGVVVQGAPTTQPTLTTLSSPLTNSDPMPISATLPGATAQPTFGFTYSGVTGAIPVAWTPTKGLSSVLARVFFRAA